MYQTPGIGRANSMKTKKIVISIAIIAMSAILAVVMVLNTNVQPAGAVILTTRRITITPIVRNEGLEWAAYNDGVYAGCRNSGAGFSDRFCHALKERAAMQDWYSHPPK